MTDIKINNPDHLPDATIQSAITMMQQENSTLTLTEITVRATEEAEQYKITPVFAPVPFERVRRITGYLVGDMSHWNNAKRAEEHDRVKHQ